MSILPQYQRLPDNTDEEDRVDTLAPKTTRLSFEDSASQPPGYPPDGSSSSAAGSPGQDQDQGQSAVHSVIYSFKARYPIVADNRDAVGVLFPTQAGATAFAQRTFPVLANYPPERIEFLVLRDVPDVHSTSKSWVSVSDEAWPSFLNDPPARIRVQIVDGPGDAENRKKFNACMTILSLTVLLVIGLAVYGAVTHRGPSHKANGIA